MLNAIQRNTSWHSHAIWETLLFSLGNYNTTHRLGGLNKTVTSHSFRAWEVQDQGVSRFGSWEKPTSSWLAYGFLLIISSHGRETEKARSPVSSYKDIISVMRTPPSQLHLNLITSRSPSSKYHHVGGYGFNICILGTQIFSPQIPQQYMVVHLTLD